MGFCAIWQVDPEGGVVEVHRPHGPRNKRRSTSQRRPGRQFGPGMGLAPGGCGRGAGRYAVMCLDIWTAARKIRREREGSTRHSLSDHD